MSKPSILLTGASGYLGGSLLTYLSTHPLDPTTYSTLYCLVRTDEQAAVVQQYGATPLRFDHKDLEAVKKAVLEHNLGVVFYLIDAFSSAGQINFIKALGELKKRDDVDVHFLHTTGAKIFSSHAGAPTDKPLYDDDPELYEIQKKQKALIKLMQTPVETNNTVIELSEKHGVKSYIFAPCIVYGKGTGFGNKISIQTVAIIKSALALRRVYSVDDGEPTWPTCSITSTTTLYYQLLKHILSPTPPPSGKQGYYLASTANPTWLSIYTSIALELRRRGLIDSPDVTRADSTTIAKMAEALECPPEMVAVSLGGLCTFMARRGGKAVGWSGVEGESESESAGGKEWGVVEQWAKEEVEIVLEGMEVRG